MLFSPPETPPPPPYGAPRPKHILGGPGGEKRRKLEGTARYGLNSEMSIPATVSTFQTVPGLPPGPSTDRNPDPLPDSNPLPPPNIEDPLKACQPAVLITGVTDGATVTVTRDRGPTGKYQR